MYDPEQRPGEDFGDWNHRNRVAQEQWDRATGQNQPQPKEPGFDWSARTPPITFGDGGGYSGSGEGLSGCLGALVFIPALVAFACLYPIPIAGAVIAGTAVGGLLDGMIDLQRGWPQLILGIVVTLSAGIAVFIGLNRLEHRLGRSMLWRAPRHVLRLALFLVVAHWIGIRAFGDGTNHALYPNPLLRQPLYILGLAAVVILVHVMLTRKGLQEAWHDRLEAIGLRRV